MSALLEEYKESLHRLREVRRQREEEDNVFTEEHEATYMKMSHPEQEEARGWAWICWPEQYDARIGKDPGAADEERRKKPATAELRIGPYLVHWGKIQGRDGWWWDVGASAEGEAPCESTAAACAKAVARAMPHSNPAPRPQQERLDR